MTEQWEQFLKDNPRIFAHFNIEGMKKAIGAAMVRRNPELAESVPPELLELVHKMIGELTINNDPQFLEDFKRYVSKMPLTEPPLKEAVQMVLNNIAPRLSDKDEEDE